MKAKLFFWMIISLSILFLIKQTPVNSTTADDSNLIAWTYKLPPTASLDQLFVDSENILIYIKATDGKTYVFRVMINQDNAVPTL